MNLKAGPSICNANGLLHGGVLMTMLDSAERLCLTSRHAKATGG